MVRGRVLVAGAGQGALLRLGAPISFWGGVDPVKGTIVDPRHPDFGQALAGRVLLLPSAVGSSSSSAIMLELLRNEVAPAAVLMGKADAILALGVVLGGELGYNTVPMVEVSMEAMKAVANGTIVTVTVDGVITSGEGEEAGP